MNRKDFFLDVSWGRIAVVSYNSEDLPLVILCHGLTDSADTFLPLIELLPTAYHYVTFDLPGCGYSDKMPLGSVITTFTFLPAFKSVADHYGDRKFMFIGHSVGAVLGLFYNMMTDGTRMTKFVDIDFFSLAPVKVNSSETGGHGRLLGNIFTFKDWLNIHANFYEPNNYVKFNASLETAPSYTKKQALEMMTKQRSLSTRSAEIVLRRNLRPDSENAGKFKFVWDQRMKYMARSPLDTEYWMKLRQRYAVPTLALVTTRMFKFLEMFNGIDLRKALGHILPYFKMVEFDSDHDVHLIMPEKLAPHIAEFLEMDLTTVKSKMLSRI